MNLSPSYRCYHRHPKIFVVIPEVSSVPGVAVYFLGMGIAYDENRKVYTYVCFHGTVILGRLSDSVFCVGPNGKKCHLDDEQRVLLATRKLRLSFALPSCRIPSCACYFSSGSQREFALYPP
jgi:hypothetical protein